MTCPDGLKELGVDLLGSDLVRLSQAAMQHVGTPPKYNFVVSGPPKEVIFLE